MGGGGRGGNRRSWPPLSHLLEAGVKGGGGRAGRREQIRPVLDAACMHVALHYVPLSHISVLLLQPIWI